MGLVPYDWYRLIEGMSWLAKTAHCESASRVNAYAIVRIACVIIMLIDEVDTWNIIRIIFYICNDIVIQIFVQEVTNALCKKFSGIAFAKNFCHVLHHADIVDLFGSGSLWAL
jgi:hypothetical protein